MKKILCVILIIAGAFTLCAGSFAKTVIYEEFDGGIDALSRYGIKLSGGTATCGEITDGAKVITAMTVSDTSEQGETAVQFNFPKSGGTVAAEIKFKLLKNMNNIYVSAGQGNSTLSKVQISSVGNVSVSDGGNTRLFRETTARLNTWITLRFCYYPSTGRVDVRCNSEIIGNIGVSEDYSGDGIDFILIQSGSGKSDIIIDYFISEEGIDLNAEVRPIEPDYTDAPVTHARKDKINIRYGDMYMFFDYEPVIRNDRVLLPFRRAFEMLGLEISYNEAERSATGKNASFEIKITDGSNVATVNGEEKLLDVMPQIIEDSFYVPVRFIAQSLGKFVDWDNAERTVIIED